MRPNPGKCFMQPRHPALCIRVQKRRRKFALLHPSIYQMHASAIHWRIVRDRSLTISTTGAKFMLNPRTRSVVRNDPSELRQLLPFAISICRRHRRDDSPESINQPAFLIDAKKGIDARASRECRRAVRGSALRSRILRAKRQTPPGWIRSSNRASHRVDFRSGNPDEKKLADLLLRL